MYELEPVDRIEIQVLIDNVTDSLSSTPAFVAREWSVLQEAGLKVIAGDSLCCANHGLSLVITTHGTRGTHTVLFDAGPADYAVERNGVRLGVDFGRTEAVILSHGHWDHAGGIPQALSLIRQKRGESSVPLYLHPGMFQQRGTRQGEGPVLPMQRVLNPEEWSLLGADPRVTKEAQLCLDDSFYISGEIPRITPYENGFPGHVCRNETTGTWEADELLIDERFVAVHVKGKGLVVFSACSHAGIVNVMHEAIAALPGIPLHAVIGGFHLSGTNERIIPETVRDMGQFGAVYIIPAHCTGWRAVNALVSEFGETVVLPCSVGKRFRM
ncbi:MAG: fold metallo-hydrolase [Acidobacteriaceae bacterium]|nr:fold metallo-hydrolase [Acidobacteriaceae bacterium]